VPHQSRVVLPLKVLQPYLLLAQPYRVLHIPAAETDADQQLDAGVSRRVADEVFLFPGLLVDHPDQPARFAPGLAPRRRPHARRLVLPHLLTQRLPLQADLAPGLLIEEWTVSDQVVRSARVIGVLGSSEAPPRTGHLAHIELLPQSGQEFASSSVSLVEGQPVEVQPIGHGPVELLQGNLPLRAVVEVVGDACLLAALAVLVPAFGQEQVGIDQGLVAFASNGEVDGNDAVLFLAHFAAILTLHAGGLLALLDMAALVDNADGARAIGGQVGQQFGHALLEDLAGLLIVPTVLGEEQLQGADAGARGQGNGLCSLAFEVREESPAIDAEVAKSLRVVAAEQEVVEVVRQGGAQVKDLLFGHGQASGWAAGSLQIWRSLTSSPLAL
jgi:hypothetical protein